MCHQLWSFCKGTGFHNRCRDSHFLQYREYRGLVGLKTAYAATLAAFCLTGLLLAALGVRMTVAVLPAALFLAATLIPILTGQTDDSHRQVGAALGVAVAGTVVVAGHARGTDFTTATHAIWWGMTACGAATLLLGFWSSTPWARASTELVAHLLAERR